MDNAAYQEMRILCAARIAALVNAIRNIPSDLAPVPRAVTQAVREQVYYGWELKLARARGETFVQGKYEASEWWTDGAAELVTNGLLKPRTRQLVREHVLPANVIVEGLISAHRSPEETADYLDARLITCTVLSSEDRLLKGDDGWDRYARAGLQVRKGLGGDTQAPPANLDFGH